MEAKSIDPSRTTAGSHAGQAVVPSRTDALSLLVEAVGETCSEKAAALSMGLAPDYWSKVKSGEKPEPRIKRLTDLPELTQRAMCRRWARQLKMRVSDEDAQRQAVTDLAAAAVRALQEIA